MRESVCMRDCAMGLSEEGMTDEIVIGSFVFNNDGSITASCLINVYHPDGRTWQVNRDIRLPLDK